MGARVGVGKGVKGYSEMGQVRGPVSVATEVSVVEVVVAGSGVAEVVVTGSDVKKEELELAVVVVDVLGELHALLGTAEENVELVSDWAATTCTTASSQVLNVGPIMPPDS